MSKRRKPNLSKAVGHAPVWLKTVQIAKPRGRRIPGSFGPASEVIRIDPKQDGEP